MQGVASETMERASKGPIVYCYRREGESLVGEGVGSSAQLMAVMPSPGSRALDHRMFRIEGHIGQLRRVKSAWNGHGQ